MRLHTNVLTLQDIYCAVPGGVSVQVTEHGSRSHARAFEVRLFGSGPTRTNSGTHGAGHEYAATWDEWGVFFARLYDIDSDMVCGNVKHPVYVDAAHYHMATCNRFRAGVIPRDTHARHTWQSIGMYMQECRKCSAGRSFVPVG